MSIVIDESWNEFFINEKSKSYFKNLIKLVNQKYDTGNYFPSKNKIFNAFIKTRLNNLKVIIIGQDPYHTKTVADGLAFSVEKDSIIKPSSLRNMFKELKQDLDIERNNYNLEDWAEQGILLLNTILTVKENEPLSCKEWGWDNFIINLLDFLYNQNDSYIFLLMGNFAKEYQKYINKDKDYIIKTVHPSGLSASRGFFGSKIFSKINNLLIKINKKRINW